MKKQTCAMNQKTNLNVICNCDKKQKHNIITTNDNYGETEAESKRNTKNAKTLVGKQNAFTMFMIFMLFGMIASAVGEHENFNITTFKNNPGVIFNKCENVYGIKGN